MENLENTNQTEQTTPQENPLPLESAKEPTVTPAPEEDRYVEPEELMRIANKIFKKYEVAFRALAEWEEKNDKI